MVHRMLCNAVRCARASALLLALAPAAFAVPSNLDPATLVDQGRRIYMDGVLPSGRPVTGVRPGGVMLTGRDAACVACHRRSGFGTVGGEIQVPPISGRALHGGSDLKDRVFVSPDPRRGHAGNQTHAPYTGPTLLRALRDGVHVTGRKMGSLMPRYPLTAADLRPLSAFLDQLSSTWSPGVTDDTVRLATVIAPGIEPVRLKAFRDTLQGALEQKNSNTLPGHRHMIHAGEALMRTERRWVLDVWELQGPPETWGRQLESFYAKAPVFALVSGLSDTVWDPVQEFCERESVPCWFPSIAVPPARAAEQYYGLYYSRGVLVEANAIAAWIGQAAPRPRRIVQVLRDEPAPRAAAAELRRQLGTPNVEDVVLSGEPALALRAALADLERGDAAILWLGPSDFAALGDVAPPQASVIASTRLTHALQPDVPARWRASLKLAYPYDLAPLRDVDMAAFHSWLKVRGLPAVDEPMQFEAYFAMAYLEYTLSEMLDNPYRDYLIDRGESMLGRRELPRAEEETTIRQGGHPPARAVRDASTLAPSPLYGEAPPGMLVQKNAPGIGMRQGSMLYSHLSLAPGQRFASNGARIVHVGADGALVADSDWGLR